MCHQCHLPRHLLKLYLRKSAQLWTWAVKRWFPLLLQQHHSSLPAMASASSTSTRCQAAVPVRTSRALELPPVSVLAHAPKFFWHRLLSLHTLCPGFHRAGRKQICNRLSVLAIGLYCQCDRSVRGMSFEFSYRAFLYLGCLFGGHIGLGRRAQCPAMRPFWQHSRRLPPARSLVLPPQDLPESLPAQSCHNRLCLCRH